MSMSAQSNEMHFIPKCQFDKFNLPENSLKSFILEKYFNKVKVLHIDSKKHLKRVAITLIAAKYVLKFLLCYWPRVTQVFRVYVYK